jgi:nitrate reductase gamma subunit
MTEVQFLTWVRGPGLNIAVGIFLLGLIWRLIEIYSLGRKKDLAPPRRVAGASGWHTIYRRTLAPAAILKRSPVGPIAGYIYHIGLFVVVFLLAQHIKLIEGLFGLSWPGLPTQIVDLTAAITLAALLVVLIDRITKPVKRFLSTFEDYFAWALTFLPVLFGFLAAKHLVLPYTAMLALHIFSVELLLIFIPFTKLFHAVALFPSRWYNGDISGHRGVAT